MSTSLHRLWDWGSCGWFVELTLGCRVHGRQAQKIDFILRALTCSDPTGTKNWQKRTICLLTVFFNKFAVGSSTFFTCKLSWDKSTTRSDCWSQVSTEEVEKILCYLLISSYTMQERSSKLDTPPSLFNRFLHEEGWCFSYWSHHGSSNLYLIFLSECQILNIGAHPIFWLDFLVYCPNFGFQGLEQSANDPCQ